MMNIKPTGEDKVEHFTIGKAQGTIISQQNGTKVVEAEYLENESRVFISVRFKYKKDADKISDYLDSFMLLVLKAME